MSYTQGGSVFPAGFQRVSDEPRQIFYDPFDAAPDTTNLWTSTSGNGGVAAAVSAGTLSLGTGTTANGYSRIVSIPSFKPTIPAWLGISFALNLPDGAAPTANAYRFWGLGTSPATPTATAPLTDAIGYELTTAGKLQIVLWSAGVRTLIADLSSSGTNTQPLNANSHRYIIYYRTDLSVFYIDGLNDSNKVATGVFQSPSIQTLPLTLLAIGGSTPPATNTQIQCVGLAVWDTGKNNTQISDGTFPFRKLKINAAGEAFTTSTFNSNQSGTWTYAAGTLTSAGNVTGTGKCVGVRVFANAVDSSFNINGGSTIMVRSNTGIDIDPRGNLINGVVNWVSGSIDVMIEVIN